MLGMSQGDAIVGVPSLNIEGGSHFVFCRKGEAYDPANGKTYIGTSNSLPVTLAIFIEGKTHDPL